MKKIWVYATVAVVGLLAQGAVAQGFVAQGAGVQGKSADAEAVPAAPDYSKSASWVCRPGSEEICTAGLDAVAVYPDGKKVALPFVAAKDPAIDCFYVYPTVSQEKSMYADMTDSPEIQAVVKAQVGRLASRCRVFAPIYRQATLYHMYKALGGGPALNFDLPQVDVAAAWDYYLEHDNKGRGVVLVGHSQGTILLQELMVKSIDGSPVQRLLVSAFLAGDPSLGVPPGKAVGGTFKHIPVCSAAAQTGCVYVWGSLLGNEVTEGEVFGRKRKDGLESACVNPAAPGGGSGVLKFFHGKDATGAAGDPPWVESVGELTGACKVDTEGNGFHVTVEAGAAAEYFQGMLAKSVSRGGWGLHGRDVALVQGNILDVMDAEIASWAKGR